MNMKGTRKKEKDGQIENVDGSRHHNRIVISSMVTTIMRNLRINVMFVTLFV